MTPQKGGSEFEDEYGDDDEEVDRAAEGEKTPISAVPSPHIASSSRLVAPIGHEPHLAQFEASISDLKVE